MPSSNEIHGILYSQDMALQLVKRILNRLKREIVGDHAPPVEEDPKKPRPFVENVFNVSNDRPAVLLCYLANPFVPGFQYDITRHANVWRTQAIARILAEHGYRVDACDWRRTEPPDASNYDLVVGLGRAFCESLTDANPRPSSIYLGTGTHPGQTNEACVSRVEEINQRRGIQLRPRLLDEDHGAEIADAIFVVGNEWVDATYHARCSTPTYRIWNSVVEGVPKPIQEKDWGQARRHYLWMAGYNPVRRRLDVLLEAFAEMPEHHLWVLGDVSAENDFFGAYRQELENLPNIHYLGYTKIDGDEFKEVATTCGYFLYPSTSDGSAGSVVNTSAVGLVPLVTEATGIDLGGHGSLIQETTVEGIRQLVKEMSAIEPDELKQQSLGVANFVRETYTKDRFIESFQQALKDSGVVNAMSDA